MTLYTGQEEQKIIENIPYEIIEIIKENYSDEIVSPLNDEINTLESKVCSLEDERDKLLDSLLELAVTVHILGLPIKKRQDFCVTDRELQLICSELDFIDFAKFGTFNDTSYIIVETGEGWHFTQN